MPLTLATFNVKDLLDPPFYDRWPDVLERKLASVAAAVADADADLLALEEMGSRAMLDAVLARLPSRGGYREVMIGAPDRRGIRVALLSRLPVFDHRQHAPATLDFPAFAVGDAPPFAGRLTLRRPIVEARVDAGAFGAVHVFVAHFKSRRLVPLRAADGSEIAPEGARAIAEAQLRSLVTRAAEALYLRGLVDERLARDPSAQVAVMGDLNDVPESVTLEVIRAEGAPGELSCAARRVPEERRWSIVHEGARAQIDHVLLTQALFARVTSARFANAHLREHAPAEDALTPPADDSDHAPLVVTLDLPSARS